MSEETSVVPKKPMTDEERLALAAKLDAELEDFIGSLEKRRYAEGWPEDRWQEEMDKHPFFMKQAPKPGDEVHPMFEGLQKLKYDPDENTNEELANNYKDDGNFYMKHKKIRMAVYSYTEGIKVNCENPKIQAVLYNNRSAAQFFLKNYRSALSDAQRAHKLDPSYMKPLIRAAQCAFQIEKFDLCKQLCEEIIDLDVDNEIAQDLLKKNKQRQMERLRDQRKEQLQAKAEEERFAKLCGILKERGIKFDDRKKNQPITKELLKPKFAPLEDYPVHLSKKGDALVWPVAFSYPEFLFSDFQQQLEEDVTMAECLASMFEEPLPCDTNNSYRPENLNIYYENRIVGNVHKVAPEKTIREIIAEKSFFVTGGSLLFYVVPANSRTEEEFIHQQRRPLVYK